MRSTRAGTIGAIAERLCVEHHTAVALVDKLEARELLRRQRSAADRRKVLVALTLAGARKLQALSRIHKQHLAATRLVAQTSVAAMLAA